MKLYVVAAALLLLTSFAAAQTTQPLPREEWGAPPVTVTHDGDAWTIAGKKQTVTLSAKDLSIRVRATGRAEWVMVPSGTNDMLVKFNGEQFPLRLADARKLDV